MLPAEYRELALALPEAVEQSHMKHPDFRVRGKIFATLGPDESWGMVKLTPQQQGDFIASHPEMFSPAAGAWGERGATIMQLEPTEVGTAEVALNLAWRNVAPKKLIQLLDDEPE